jgi:hypothetical protein
MRIEHLEISVAIERAVDQMMKATSANIEQAALNRTLGSRI